MMTPPRSIKAPTKWSVTREGWAWLGITAFLWFTGLLKGINLVTLLAALMAAVFLLNALTAGRRLKYFRARRWIDAPVFAGAPTAVEVEVENLAAKHVIGVRVEDGGPAPALTWFAPRFTTGIERFHGHTILPHSGWYPWEALRVSSAAPFGLARRTLLGCEAEPVLVYPAKGRLHSGRLRRFLKQANAALDEVRRTRAATHPAAQSELHGVRPFRSGDSPRWIHWRTSARKGELMVREFEESPSESLLLILDCGVPALSELETKQSAGQSTALLAQAVALATTICREWCRRPGNHLAVATAGFAPVVFSGIRGPERLPLALECLTLAPACAQPNVPRLLDCLADNEAPPGPILLISTRSESFSDELAAALGRPVAFVNIAALSEYDFYEPANSHAS